MFMRYDERVASPHPRLRRHHDVVEAELVDIFRRRDNANPVTKGVLLQELFGQILEIAF